MGARIATRDQQGPKACRRKFLRFFSQGFTDETYLAWERDYKWEAHQRWEELLNRKEFATLLTQRKYGEIANRAARVESHTNLLFSFEKMAFRDAVRTPHDARAFAKGLYEFLYGEESPAQGFVNWCETIAGLPRKQTRVLTWPLVTVFGYLAMPSRHIFLKPMVMRKAAQSYGGTLEYASKPNWITYSSFLKLAAAVRHDLLDLHPRDMIDLQSFLWVQGSDEYANHS